MPLRDVKITSEWPTIRKLDGLLYPSPFGAIQSISVARESLNTVHPSRENARAIMTSEPRCMSRILAGLTFLAAHAVLYGAGDPMNGWWKANMTKSQPDSTHRFQSARLRIEFDKSKLRLTSEGINGKGQTISNTQEFVADGKEHPMAGGVGVITKRKGKRRFEMSGIKDGAVVSSATYEVSRDGERLDSTVSGANTNGSKFTSRIVFDREDHP